MSKEVTRRYIFAIFVLALVVRVGYAIVTPPFQAPDEYSHYSYVKFVNESRRLPIQPNPAVRPEELEFHQPPLYYVAVAPLFSSRNLVEHRPLLTLRFINILFSMLTLLIVYWFAATVFPDKPFVVVLMCAGVALLPTYSYLSASMRNGILATFFASLGFYLCAKAVLDEEQQRNVRWSWIGVVAGLAILSKLSAIGFACAAGLTLLMTSPNLRTSLQRAGWFGLGVMSTAGWWFTRNWLVYGHWLKVVENGGGGYTPPPLSWSHEKASAITIFKTFWAVFGRINEYHFADIYRFYWLFVGVVAVGIVRYAYQRKGEVPRELLGLFMIAIAVSMAATFYYAHNYNSDQGRYMFPVLIPIMSFIAVGLSTLVPARYHRLALDTLVFSFAWMNVAALARLASIYWHIF